MRKTKSKAKAKVVVKFSAVVADSGKAIKRRVVVRLTKAMQAAPSLITEVARKRLGKLVDRCHSVVWRTGVHLNMNGDSLARALDATPEEE